MAVWNVSPFKFNIIGNDTLLSPWREVTGPGERINNHWNIAALPNYQVQQVAFVDMGLHNVHAHAINEDRLTLAENGTFVLNIRGVEHIDAPADKTVDLEVVGKTGFTTDGSLNSIETNVGHHVIYYTGSTRDSTLFTGVGWDESRLIDHPSVAGTQYWSLVRRADGEVDAYSLYSGYKVMMIGGGTTWGNTSGRLNYGEVDEIYAASRNRGQDIFKPGIDVPTTGDRGSFDNIDLSDAAVANYTDRFIAASFKSVHYATQNVHVGTAIIETFNGDATGGNQSSSRDHIATNGNHHLLVNEETAAIDGHLRLYVRDNNSGLYNRFNEVYLGTSAAEVNTNDYSTTSKNAYATSGSGGGAVNVLGTAMYGFGGNDVLTGGSEVDYLFGGASTFTTIPVSSAGIPGNILTGGDGNDYFGVGNISAGADGDAIMSTDFTSRLSGTAPLDSERSGLLSQLNIVSSSVVRTADAADLATRVATDRITDWTAGADSLRVLSNGTAIIEGLGTANGSGAGGYVVDQIGSDAERIDLSGSQVVNNGKIVVRGLGGVDTLIGSRGNDWLYGNAASNYYDLSEGGNDRIYIDQFDGSRSKHFVNGFTTSSTPNNADLVMLNKRVIDSFYSGGRGSTALTANAQGEYVQAQGYDSGLNFLHDPYYNPSIAAPNSTHTSADGGAYWDGSANGGSDQTTSYVGLGMAVAGRALFAVPFVGPIIGAALIATGTLLGGVGFYPRTTKPHLNATFDGNVGAYLNVLTENPNAVSGSIVKPITSVSSDETNVRFLDFFQGNNAGDGYIPVVEFTAHAGQGIYGYFALHSTTETFIFLVASRDNLVENGEAIMVGQINGNLTAADFGIYDGEQDIYNYGVLPAVVLRDPTITTIADTAATPDQGQTDGRIENATNPIVITGSVSGALSDGSFFRVYDGSTKIYDGQTAVSGQVVSLSQSGTNFTFTDSRSLGTTVRKTTNTSSTDTSLDDTYVLSDGRVLYTVELVDGETGIPSRVSSRDITITGGSGVINGGGGNDLLLMTQTSSFINGFATDANGNNRLQGIESISLSPNPLASTSVTLSSGVVTGISFAGNAGTGLANGTYVITISNEVVSPAVSGTGAVATVTVSGGSITNATVISGGSGYSSTTQALFSEGISLNLTGQTEGIQVIGGSGTDTITGGGGNDTIYGMAGGDSISLSAGGDDKVVYSYDGSQLGSDAFYDIVTGMVGGSDAVEASDWVNKDTNSSRLMYETAVLGSNKAVSSATELLVVSNSAVSTAGDLTNDIATALGSAFNVAGLDGTSPTASTGGGSNSTSLFAVLSNEAGKWWVGRYVDSGNDDVVSGSDIEVFGLFTTDNILNSFWQSTVLAPQAVTLTLPADTGPSESAFTTYYTQNTTVTVGGLASGNRLYYTIDNGSNWTTGAVDATTFTLNANLTYTAGHIQVRQVDASGNYSPISTITSSTRTVVTDNIAPNAPASAPDLANDDDNGTSLSDNLTTLTTGLTFSGSVSEPGSLVNIYSVSASGSDTLLAMTTADSSGNYLVDVSLAYGIHDVGITASDLAGNFSGLSPLTRVVVSYTDISSNQSLITPTGNVQVNNTSFNSAETIDSPLYVLPSVVSTKSSFHLGSWTFDTSGEVLSTNYGLVTVGDAYMQRGSWSNGTSNVNGVLEIISNNSSEIASAISGMTTNAAWVNTRSFFYFEGYDTTRDPFNGQNFGVVWYWADTGNGSAETNELTIVGVRGSIADPSGNLLFPTDFTI